MLSETLIEQLQKGFINNWLGLNSELEGTQSQSSSHESYTLYKSDSIMEEQFSRSLESAYEKCCLHSHFNWEPNGGSDQTWPNGNAESTFYIPVQNVLDTCIQIGYDALREDTRDMRCSAQ